MYPGGKIGTQEIVNELLNYYPAFLRYDQLRGGVEGLR
jgi:hypothetical protein